MSGYIAKTTILLVGFVLPRYLMATEANDAGDLVAKITACLPAGWQATLESRNHDLVICVATPPIDTRPSSYSNAENGTVKEAVTIKFQVGPRHSPPMLRRIHTYNEPLAASLKTIPYHMQEVKRREILARMIPYPMFQDGQYGYIILPPSRTPERPEDFEIIRHTLRKICKDWQPVDEGGMKVRDIPKMFNYR